MALALSCMGSRHAQQRPAPSTVTVRCPLPHSRVRLAAQGLSSATAGAGEQRHSGESYVYAGAACKQIIHTAWAAPTCQVTELPDNSMSILEYFHSHAYAHSPQLPQWVCLLSNLPGTACGSSAKLCQALIKGRWLANHPRAHPKALHMHQSNEAMRAELKSNQLSRHSHSMLTL